MIWEGSIGEHKPVLGNLCQPPSQKIWEKGVNTEVWPDVAYTANFYAVMPSVWDAERQGATWDNTVGHSVKDLHTSTKMLCAYFPPDKIYN